MTPSELFLMSLAVGVAALALVVAVGSVAVCCLIAIETKNALVANAKTRKKKS